MTSSANGASRCGFRNSPAAAGVFSKPAYAKRIRSAASPSFPGSGAGTGKMRAASTAKMPSAIRNRSGRTFPNASATPVRAPCLTPRTLIHASASNGIAIVAARAAPAPAGAHSALTASAKATERLAATVTRATQVIQPTSNPTNSPNAAVV
jgi:hypothetical protein